MIKKQYILSFIVIALFIGSIIGSISAMEELADEPMELITQENLSYNDNDTFFIQLIQIVTENDPQQKDSALDIEIVQQQVEIPYKIVKLCKAFQFIQTGVTEIKFLEKDHEHFNSFLMLLPFLKILADETEAIETRKQQTSTLVQSESEEQRIKLLDVASYFNCEELYHCIISCLHSNIHSKVYAYSSDQETTHRALLEVLQLAERIETTDHFADLFDTVSGDSSPKIKFTVKSQHQLKGHTSWVNAVSFSWDTKKVASGSWDHSIKIWDVATESCLLSIPAHTKSINSVSFSRDGKKIASGSEDATIKIFDATTGAHLQTFVQDVPVHSVSFCPNGKKVAGSLDKVVKIFDLKSEEAVTLEGHTSTIRAASFSYDGKKIVSCSYDSTIKIWNSESGTCELTLKGHTSWVTCVAFSPDGTKIVSGSHDNTIKIWDATTGGCLITFDTFQEWITSVSFLPCGTKVIGSSYDKSITIWDLQTGECLCLLNNSYATPYSVSCSSDGAKVAVGFDDATLSIYDFHVLSKEFTLSPLLFLNYVLFHKTQGTLQQLSLNNYFYRAYKLLPPAFKKLVDELLDVNELAHFIEDDQEN
jgi:WD40 repeat protein